LNRLRNGRRKKSHTIERSSLAQKDGRIDAGAEFTFSIWGLNFSDSSSSMYCKKTGTVSLLLNRSV
jgi:hypothetical protein